MQGSVGIFAFDQMGQLVVFAECEIHFGTVFGANVVEASRTAQAITAELNMLPEHCRHGVFQA